MRMSANLNEICINFRNTRKRTIKKPIHFFVVYKSFHFNHSYSCDKDLNFHDVLKE